MVSKPFIAFSDESNSYKLTVLGFDNTNWVNVGSPGFSEGLIEYTSLAINKDNKLYVAFEDYGEEGKAVLKKFDGSEWDIVGSDGFSSAEADFIDLDFSPDGQPCVVFEDYANAGKATVMKYDSVYVSTNELMEAGFYIYPNPANNEISVEMSGEIRGNKLSISNINGQVINTYQIITPKIILDLSHLPNGVYVLRFVNEKKAITRKIIKQ